MRNRFHYNIVITDEQITGKKCAKSILICSFGNSPIIRCKLISNINRVKKKCAHFFWIIIHFKCKNNIEYVTVCVTSKLFLFHLLFMSTICDSVQKKTVRTFVCTYIKRVESIRNNDIDLISWCRLFVLKSHYFPIPIFKDVICLWWYCSAVTRNKKRWEDEWDVRWWRTRNGRSYQFAFKWL